MKKLLLAFLMSLMICNAMADETLVKHLEGLTLCTYAITDGKPSLMNTAVIKNYAEAASAFEVSIINDNTIFLFEKKDAQRNTPYIFSLYDIASETLNELYSVPAGKINILAATCNNSNVFSVEENIEEKNFTLVKRNFDSEIDSSIVLSLSGKDAYAIKQIFIDASGKYLAVFIPYYQKIIVFSTIDGHECFFQEGRPLSVSLNKEKIYYSLGGIIFEMQFNDEKPESQKINSAAGKKEEIAHFEELSDEFSIVSYETRKKQGFLSILMLDDVYASQSEVCLCKRAENTLKRQFTIEKLKNTQYSFYAGGNGWFCMYDYKK